MINYSRAGINYSIKSKSKTKEVQKSSFGVMEIILVGLLVIVIIMFIFF